MRALRDNSLTVVLLLPFLLFTVSILGHALAGWRVETATPSATVEPGERFSTISAVPPSWRRYSRTGRANAAKGGLYRPDDLSHPEELR